MTIDSAVSDALSNYTDLQQRVQAKGVEGAGGFSGAKIWRVEAEGRSYCLRRWPAEHPDHTRLAFIHLVLRKGVAEGLDFVPAPLQTHAGQTVLEIAGHFWELSPWMPGEADFWSSPAPQRLSAAMQALATFHLATRHAVVVEPRLGPAPAVLERRDRLARSLAGDLDGLINAASRRMITPLLDTSMQDALQLAPTIGSRLLPQLVSAAEFHLPLQPAIRDIWHDHLLFTGDRVTGIVDFGALRIDTPLTDIARLIGSLVEDDKPQRIAALSAYSDLQPLSDRDEKLIDLLDQSSVLLGLLNWCQWLYVEQRQFADLPAIEARVLKLFQRLLSQL
jgi:Ser/Thr protein kinase RdoA (MazF antagonist)